MNSPPPASSSPSSGAPRGRSSGGGRRRTSTSPRGAAEAPPSPAELRGDPRGRRPRRLRRADRRRPDDLLLRRRLDAETGDPRWVRHLGDSNVPAATTTAADDGHGDAGAPGRPIPAAACSRWTGRPSTTRPTSAPSPPWTSRPAPSAGWPPTPQQDRPPGRPGPRPQPRHRPRRPRDRRPRRLPGDLRLRRRHRPARLEDRPRCPTSAHLLGVAKGRLIATGNHVWSIDAATGKVLRCWPDDQRGFEGYGRGILAGDQIYWPTRTEIHVLDQASGLRGDRPPIKLQETFHTGGGNLAVGDGYLIVAQADALVVFCQNSRLIERFREEIAREPDRASTYYRLAQVAEATGDEALALESLAQASTQASPSEVIDGMPLVDRGQGASAPPADEARGEGRRREGLAPRPSGGSRPPPAAAATDRDRLAPPGSGSPRPSDGGGDAPAAVATLQGILADDRLRALPVAADERRTVRADLVDRRPPGRPAPGRRPRRLRRVRPPGRRPARAGPGRGRPAAAGGGRADIPRRPGRARGPAGPRQARRVDRPPRRRPPTPTSGSCRARPTTPSAPAPCSAWPAPTRSQRLWGPARDAYLQARARFADLVD